MSAAVWQIWWISSAILFCLFYPMMVSIYVFLPLFVGYAGYILIRGIENEQWGRVALSSAYLLNLEANLSLPYFVTIAVSLGVFLYLYPKTNLLRGCPFCRAFVVVGIIDGIYIATLLGYDVLLQSESLVLDVILVYSLLADLLMAVIFP